MFSIERYQKNATNLVLIIHKQLKDKIYKKI